MEKAFEIYKNPVLLKLTPFKILTAKQVLKEAYGDIQKTEFIYNEFKKDKRFYIDAGHILTNENEDYQITIYNSKLETSKINEGVDKYRITLDLILIEDYYVEENKTRRKIPVPNSVGRTPVPKIITKPLCITVTFDIIGKIERGSPTYTQTTFDEYYQASLTQEGGKMTKAQLIELCKKKNIPYSGRTKAELRMALHRTKLL